MALTAGVLEGMTGQAAAQIEGRQIAVKSPPGKQRQRVVTAGRKGVATGAEINHMTGRTLFPIHGRHAAMCSLVKTQGHMSFRLHDAVAVGTVVAAGRVSQIVAEVAVGSRLVGLHLVIAKE